MSATETMCVVKDQPTVQGYLVAQGSIPLANVIVANGIEPPRWPFPMYCSVFAYRYKDPGLCCYACCCPSCLAAETNALLGVEGFCGSASCAHQWTVTCLLDLMVGSVTQAGWVAWWAFFSLSRRKIEESQSLPPDEVCCDHPLTTFFFCCTPCALYQQAYYAKHTVGREFQCCCYTKCCSSSVETRPLL